ncbi:hypothetical protein [Paucilactobacillus sp. N302-9]
MKYVMATLGVIAGYFLVQGLVIMFNVMAFIMFVAWVLLKIA